uniref:Uncharacterized protein n=1 Tax=Roseihalotalea indica TaxID=2867963 RepID=A0AA49GSW8_9BACT|nr:hypothetical protein K4G66_30985 [Tunicatimonas sp. TK19036]
MTQSNNFETKARQALSEIYDKIKELEDQAKKVRADLDEKLEEQMSDMKGKDSKVYQTLEDLKFSSTAAFHDIRQGMEKASEALREALKKASYHFK